MLTQELSHFVLNFKTGMHHRPVVRGSNECEEREQIFETSASKYLPQDLPSALGLRRLHKDQRRENKIASSISVSGAGQSIGSLV
jgi:hypothetical protein